MTVLKRTNILPAWEFLFRVLKSDIQDGRLREDVRLDYLAFAVRAVIIILTRKFAADATFIEGQGSVIKDNNHTFMRFPYTDLRGETYANLNDFLDKQQEHSAWSDPVFLEFAAYLLGYNLFVKGADSLSVHKRLIHPFPFQGATIVDKGIKMIDGKPSQVWGVHRVSIEENNFCVWTVLAHYIRMDVETIQSLLQKKYSLQNIVPSLPSSKEKTHKIETQASKTLAAPASIPPSPIKILAPVAVALPSIPEPPNPDFCTEKSIRDLWKELIIFLENKDIDIKNPDEKILIGLMREFSTHVLERHPGTTSINIGTQVLMRFPSMVYMSVLFKEGGVQYLDKVAFLAEQKKDEKWGDESLLLFILYHLGLAPTISFKGADKDFSNEPFTQPYPIGEIAIQHEYFEIPGESNFTGWHWELVEASCAKDNNCMFRMLAKIVIKYINEVSEKLSTGESLTKEKTSAPSVANPSNQINRP